METNFLPSPELSQGNSQENISETVLIDRLFVWATVINQYYTPLLCLFGAIGNCLSIIVFLSKSPKARSNLSSSVYLIALAISDTGYLINLFIVWLDNIGINILTNQFICPLCMYLGQLTGFLSVWFIVAFTIERFFAVCYPLFRPSRCTASRAKKIVIGLTLIAAIGFSYVLVIARSFIPEFEGQEEELMSLRNDSTSLSHAPNDSWISNDAILLEETHHYNHQSHSGSLNDSSENVPEEDWKSDSVPDLVPICSVPFNYHRISEISTYVDSLLTFVVPFVLIFALNMKIIFCIKKVKGHRESMLASSKINSRYNVPKPDSQKPKRFKLWSFCSCDCCYKMSISKICMGSRDRLSHSKTSTSETNKGDSLCPECTRSQRCTCPHQKLVATTSLRSNSKSVQQHSSVESDSSQSTPGQVTPPFKRPFPSQQQPNATEIRVTKTLLLVSSIFLLLHFPSHLIRVIRIWALDPNVLHKLILAQHLMDNLFNTNFSINFILYCCSGKAFRHSLKNLLGWNFCTYLFCRRKLPSPSNTTVVTTQLTFNNTDSVGGKYLTRITRNAGNGRQQRKSLEEDQV